MAKNPLPTPEQLRQLLSYDPETGDLTWRARDATWFGSERDCKKWNTRYAGSRAFRQIDGHGRCNGVILGRNYRAHRVAWAIFHGLWPCGEIDHIDGNPANNKITNLREVSRRENMRNTKVRTDNTSGVTGVRAGRWRGWQASIMIDGRDVYLGTFSTVAEASVARRAAEQRLGFHPNHGRAGHQNTSSG